jgi:hypothetical protein
MASLDEIATPFVAVAHRIVWASVATVDAHGRPRSRVLHPYWEWDGESLVGWIATGPTPVKTAHLARSPYVSVNYWDAEHDVATAECAVTWQHDDDTCTRIWHRSPAPRPVATPGVPRLAPDDRHRPPARLARRLTTPQMVCGGGRSDPR